MEIQATKEWLRGKDHKKKGKQNQTSAHYFLHTSVSERMRNEKIRGEKILYTQTIALMGSL